MKKIKEIILKPLKWFGHTSRKKKSITIIALIILVFFIIGRIQSANQPSPYKMAKTKRGSITEVVSETGSVASNGKVDIYSPSNGIVEEVLIANGDNVTVGVELFTVKSSANEQEKSLALANYLAAKSTLDTANATLFSLQALMFSYWDTYKKLAESGSYENDDGSPKNDQRTLPEYHIAEKNWFAAESNYKKQQSVINQAQAAVSSSYLLYLATQNATVKATADGTVSNLSITRGSTVQVNTPTSPAPPVLSIANLQTIEAVVSLSESDIVKIKEGQNAIIDINGASDKDYKGVVKRVDTIGTDEQGVIRYKAYLEILTTSTNLRPGMTADVTITTKKISNTLSVPNSAVKPYQGGKAVRILDEKTKEIKYIPVRIGVKGEKSTQILSGIKEGEEVVTALSNVKVQRPGLFGGS